MSEKTRDQIMTMVARLESPIVEVSHITGEPVATLDQVSRADWATNVERTLISRLKVATHYLRLLAEEARCDTIEGMDR